MISITFGNTNDLALTAIHKTPARLHTILVILISFIFQGCNFNGPNISRTWVNDRIDEKKREEINILNRKFFLGFKNNDVSAIKSMMADSLVKIMGSRLDSLVTQVNPFFQTDDFSTLNEYNILNTTTPAANSVFGTDLHGNKYTIAYSALNKEMYVSLFQVKCNKNIQLLVTAVYGNYQGKWELNIFHIGQYKFYDKTAIDFYQMARKDFARSDLADAVCNLTIASYCIRPADQLFQYEKEDEYKMFFDSVSNVVKSKYRFPITLDGIPGKPKVFNIVPKIDEGYFPTVLYVTKIDIRDTVSLKAEYEKVKGEVKQIFPGIGTGKKYTLYQAYNEIPHGKPVPEYTFADEH